MKQKKYQLALDDFLTAKTINPDSTKYDKEITIAKGKLLINN